MDGPSGDFIRLRYGPFGLVGVHGDYCLSIPLDF
jgi:hypothetical protein